MSMSCEYSSDEDAPFDQATRGDIVSSDSEEEEESIEEIFEDDSDDPPPVTDTPPAANFEDDSDGPPPVADTPPAANKSFDRLLRDNRAPRVSELRTALIAAYSSSEAGATDSVRWLFHKASAATHARLAFSDSMALHGSSPPRAVLKPRRPTDAADGGGLMLAAGVYAACNLAAGDVITLFDIHALDSTMCSTNHVDHELIMDQRLEFDADGAAASVADEGLAFAIGPYSTGYHFSGALARCPFRLGQFVNDSVVLSAPDDVASLESYEKSSQESANSQRVGIMGFALQQIATRPIKKGDEITSTLGAVGWERVRAVKGRPCMRPTPLLSRESEEHLFDDGRSLGQPTSGDQAN